MTKEGPKGYHYKILSSTNFTSVACGYFTNTNITINTNSNNTSTNSNSIRKNIPDE